MELLVPILIYFGYSILVAVIKKLKSEYQESDLASYTPDEMPKSEKPEANKQPINGEKSKVEERNKIEEPAIEINKKGTAQLELEEKRQELEARKAEAEKKQQEVREKLKSKQEKTPSVAKQNNGRLNIKNLDRNMLRQGVVLAEILQPPRAKRPYQAKDSSVRGLSKGKDVSELYKDD
ncbi:hypothetical protein [Acetohalobium arabaticum]|uniref:Uncharacterized protein n=1 Tax=Acetohalobium arabaticum (strain ATCC 49924 / DSM 5501 / Z-7288) TaxID=574087 RepID=D9QV96_ACEAZ|nr:hypothetical protein [Acetohalobium arabaticum]ADL12155.1 hypothetical protein Acear_0613 [Acetohalobium arabaticum DSM 5501]